MRNELLVCPTINLKRGAAGGTGAGKAKPAAGDRIVTGICSVFGTRDSVADIMQPGAFKKSIQDFNAKKGRVKFLWNHSAAEPPVARIVELRELSRNELPAELKSDANIEGALLVRRQYLTDYYSDRIYKAVLAGAISEMSFAFTVDDFEYRDMKGEKSRLVKSVELYDVSDVVWGAHSQTMGILKGATILTLEKVQALKGQRLQDKENREKLEELKYYMKRLPKKPLTRQQWANQMRLNKAKLDAIRLGC